MRRTILSVCLLAGVLAAPVAVEAAPATCAGLAVTVQGTNASETLRGTSGPDVIHGYAGDDRIIGFGGDDVICGGAGNDFVNSGAGADIVRGGPGDDTLVPGRGDDSVNGGPGSDLVSFASSTTAVTVSLRSRSASGQGDDSIVRVERVLGSWYGDLIVGSPGDDVLRGGGGKDRIRGLAGDDTLAGGAGRDLLVGGTGRDVCSQAARTRSCLEGLELSLIADLDGAAGVAVTPPGSSDLVVVAQSGILWRVAVDGSAGPTVLLDITDRVADGGELGLLGLAFHPGFESNGRFFVDYTNWETEVTISEFLLPANADTADPDSERVLLTIPRAYPGYTNHNGGMLAFGPDGYLYASVGDGGRGGDPDGHGQNTATLYGTILRLDVDAAEPYGVPSDNPFVDAPGADEIWAYGLRNPWRMSFDPVTGDLWIGDVGQGAWEEITVIDAGMGGMNLGWSTLEGSHCYPPDSACSASGTALPIHEYPTRRPEDNTCSVIGGYVYRGSRLPELAGRYLYADFCAGWIESLRSTPAGTATELTRWISPGESPYGRITSFGADGAGELYVLTIDGEVLRIDPVR